MRWLLVLGLLGCADPSPQRNELRVFAASSLTEAFGDIETSFEAAHPDVDVKLVFAGSQVLRLQIEQGADADVFASADASHIDALVGTGHVDEARVFAHNELVVIVPPDSSLQDFAQLSEATRIVIGTQTVPIGIYTERMLQRAEGALGRAFVDGVRARIVSHESNVRLVRAKVEMGEADAAIVYRTDATSSDRVRIVEIPPELQVRAEYRIGRVTPREGRHADQLIDHVRSDPGQRALQRHGFLPMR